MGLESVELYKIKQILSFVFQTIRKNGLTQRSYSLMTTQSLKMILITFPLLRSVIRSLIPLLHWRPGQFVQFIIPFTTVHTLSCVYMVVNYMILKNMCIFCRQITVTNSTVERVLHQFSIALL